MKKLLNLAGLILVATLILGVSTGRIYARLTGTNPGTDVWCVGVSGAEVCVDTSGNFIPTTDNDTTLGTSSLRWATIHAYDLTLADDLTVTDDATVTDDMTVSDDLTVAGDLFHTAVATQTIGASGTISVAGACNGFIRLRADANVTTDTTNTMTAPTAANIGCVYYIVNTGGGTITFDDNALFNAPNSENMVLATNEGAIVVQGSVAYYVLATSDN